MKLMMFSRFFKSGLLLACVIMFSFLSLQGSEVTDNTPLPNGWKLLVVRRSDCHVCSKWMEEVDDHWHNFNLHHFVHDDQKFLFDVDNEDDQEKLAELISQDTAPVMSVPSFIFVDPDGLEHQDMRIVGYGGSERFMSELKKKLLLIQDQSIRKN